MKTNKDIECTEVIISRLSRRGKGEKFSPIRVITEVFTKEGDLIAEYDPSPETFTLMDMVHFARYCQENKFDNVVASHVHKWLDTIQQV